jgi:hypothetical protein
MFHSKVLGRSAGRVSAFLFFSVVCANVPLFGDSISFTGKVTDATDSPVKGAVIALKNAGLATTSDSGGLYTLTGNPVAVAHGTPSFEPFRARLNGDAIEFAIDKRQPVWAGIYTVSGALVLRVLPNRELQPGRYRVRIENRFIARGIYLVKVCIGDNSTILKYSPAGFFGGRVAYAGNAAGALSKRATAFGDTLVCQKNGLMSQSVAVTATTGTVNFKLSPRSFTEFVTNQNAVAFLNATGFNNAGFLNTPGDGLLFNHPGTIGIDGTHFLLADTRNNRVLIWNTLPNGNVSPDLVLGQTTLTTNNSGSDLGSMDWPTSVCMAGGKIVVADAYNNRILIWNSLPSANGQSADFALANNLPAANPNSGFGGCWPWAVWTDGTKLVVAATASSVVLIWNSFPTGDAAPSITLTGKDPTTGNPVFGTPRTINTDGSTYLMIGDHNSYPSLGGTSGSFFWTGFPTTDQAFSFMLHDYGLNNSTPTPMPVLIWGGQRHGNQLVALAAPAIAIWNSLPTQSDQLYSSFVGCGNGFDLDPPVQGQGYRFTPGDDGDLKIASSGQVYASLNFENMVVGYNSFPTAIGQLPDFAIGSPDINTNPFYGKLHCIDNPLPATNGTVLIATSSIDRKLAVWNNVPTISGTMPDTIYDLGNRQFSVSAVHGSTFVTAGLDGVTPAVDVWNSLPPKSGTPDVSYAGAIGNVNFASIGGVGLDNKYLYVTDQNTEKIYIWTAMPAATDNPLFSLNVPRPGSISSDGTYFVVSYVNMPNEWGCKIYQVNGLSAGSTPVATLPPNGAAYSFSPSNPIGVLIADNHLFLSDFTAGRILVWTSIDSAIALKNPDVVLGQSSLTQLPLGASLAQNRLFWPSQMAFDGVWLWVGEYKFSGRLVAF